MNDIFGLLIFCFLPTIVFLLTIFIDDLFGNETDHKFLVLFGSSLLYFTYMDNIVVYPIILGLFVVIGLDYRVNNKSGRKFLF